MELDHRGPSLRAVLGPHRCPLSSGRARDRRLPRVHAAMNCTRPTRPPQSVGSPALVRPKDSAESNAARGCSPSRISAVPGAAARLRCHTRPGRPPGSRRVAPGRPRRPGRCARAHLAGEFRGLLADCRNIRGLKSLVRARGGGESAGTPDPVPAPRCRWRPSISAGGCPPALAAYPGVWRAGHPPPARPCSGWGLPSHPGHPGCWCALTAPFHPCLCRLPGHRRSVLCGTDPAGHPDWALPSTLPYGVRTFLGRVPVASPRRARTRPPGRLTTRSIFARRAGGDIFQFLSLQRSERLRTFRIRSM